MAPQLPPYMAPFQLLELNIISAQELCSVSRSMKTYAVAWVHPDRKLSTRVDPHGHTNPTWNDKFVFRVDDFFLQNELSAVMIEIYARHWWRDVLVGTIRVLVESLIPSNRLKQSSLGRHPLGMTFVALQVRRPSGRPQGILNIGVGLLDSSMRSMPLYSQLSSSAVGYRDLMGEHQQKQHVVQNYHQHDNLVQKPELRRTRSDTSSMVFDHPKVDIGRNVGNVKPKKGKANSWISGSTSEFGDVKETKKKKKANSMISGASIKDTTHEDTKKVSKQVSSSPPINANPPKGIICKPQLKREPSMKRVTISEHVLIQEHVVEKHKEPECKASTSPPRNQEPKKPKANVVETNNKNISSKDAPKEVKEIRPTSPPLTKLVPPPPPPKYTPLPPPMYTPLQKLDVENKHSPPPMLYTPLQKLEVGHMKLPLDITDSELGPSPSEIETTMRAKHDYEKGSSIVSGWSLGSSVEGLQSKLDRWRAELPTVYDKSEYASYVSDDVVLRPKPTNVNKRRRQTVDQGGQEGAMSCFSNICGVQCSIVCGAPKAKPVKKGSSGRGRADDSVLFY